jgi:endonuclease YncB( thermonuclease family)
VTVRVAKILAAVLCVGAAAGSYAAGGKLAGEAQALKGDSVIIRSSRIQLYGITAPQPDEQCQAAGGAWPCGTEALKALSKQVDGRQLACRLKQKAGHGFWQASCQLADTDVAEMQVRAGWARALIDKYTEAEAQAQTAGRGLWRR